MAAKKDIDKVMKKLESIKKKLTSKDSLEEIGDEAVVLIKKRTRAGYGVDSKGSTKQKLKKLSTPYINQRKKKKPSGPTTPSKSNLTSSGDMLDDLTPKSPKQGKVEIGFKDKKSRDKAKYVSKDRPFNNLSGPELKQMKAFIQKIVNKLLKK